jgi:hypothetical protein
MTQTQYIANQAPATPIVFLGATVMSFNASIGFGSSVSTLTVSLIEDCQTNPPQVCDLNRSNADPLKAIVGDPVFFTVGMLVLLRLVGYLLLELMILENY